VPLARAPVVLLLALGLGLAACSSGGSGEPEADDAAPATSAPRAAGTASTCDVTGATFKRESTVGSDSSLITSAEVSDTGCSDRIEFRFQSLGADLPPKYVVEYAPGPFRDVNQLYEVDVSGESDLVIRFDQVGATDLEGELVFGSRESIAPGNLRHLAELRWVVGPEGSVMFVAGLDGERPFSVDGASSPPRVIVTIG
jgi:hypothetical protein